MALVLADRVQETTATTGTGSITLGGAVSGYQSFAVVGNGNTCYYTIVNGSAWEVGIGTYSTTGPTLARTTVLSNSSGNTSPITLAGASSVFLTYPAEKSVNLDADGVLMIGEPIGYSDTGIIATFASTVAGYNQVVFQNKSTATNASANINVSNDASTGSLGFAELGINSSTFSNGAGAFNIPGAAYLASASTDLSIGTYGAYDIHFATNSSTVDSMTIFDNGGVSLGGYGNPGIGNISANKFVPGYSAVTSAGGTTTLTAASSYYQRLTGTQNQTFVLPDATTLVTGTTFLIANDSTGTLTIKDGATTTIESIPATGVDYIYLISNSTVAGTWKTYSFNPSNYDFTSGNANFGGATITSAVWNGTTIAGGYGGTGLTSFGGANNAIYSTGSTTLTAGTLPVAAGGTGISSLTANYIPVGNGTSAFTSSASLQFASGVLVVGGSSVLGGATNPITAFTGSTNNYIQTYVYNQSTGISASSDFVAYTNNSTDAHGWADLGFTSSTYADPVYTVTGPNEAYVFGSALNSSFTGNLVYATDSTGSANAHQWYVGGFTQAKSAWKMQLTSTGLQLANALAVAYGGTGVTTSTGSGANVLATSPTLVTPILGTPQSGNFSTGTFTWPTFNQNTTGTAAGLSATLALTSGGTGATSAQAAMNALAQAVTSGQYLRGNGTNVVMSAIQAADVPTLNQNTTGSSASVSGSAALTVQSNYQAAINTTTPGLSNYGMHFGGQTTADYAAGITWNGGTGTTGAQAGIYVQGSGAYGTRMYIATTDSYASGAKTAISVNELGVTNFVRARPTALGNTIVDSATTAWQRIQGNGVNYGSYGSIGVSGTTNTYAGISFTDVAGVLMMSSSATGFYYNNTTWRVYWDGSGNQNNTGNVTAYASDERLKSNVTPIANARKMLRQIDGVYFDWDLEECNKWEFYPPAKDIGLLAQRVQKIVPEAVHQAPFDKDPLVETGSKSGKNYLTVQYEKLVPLLVQTGNEHDELIDQMQERIDKLEALVAKLLEK